MEEEVHALVEREAAALPEASRAELRSRVLLLATGLGPLEPLLADPTVDEVMVNGPGAVYVERRGRLERTGVGFAGEAELMHAIERVLAPLGRRVDEASPLCDARLADGSRVNVVIPPLSLSGPCLTVRRFRREGFSLRDLVSNGTLPAALAELLAVCVAARASILVSGGTGSGKTTTLNALSGAIPGEERIVTIEDAAELRLRQRHVVRLEARPANLEGRGEVTIRQLVRNALRMRPDRIVVGEVRGAEALDMLQALNTGHDGSLTTVHANSPEDALRRVETLALMAGVGLPHAAVREQAASALDLIVHQAGCPTARARWSRSPRWSAWPAGQGCASCTAAAASRGRRATATWRSGWPDSARRGRGGGACARLALAALSAVAAVGLRDLLGGSAGRALLARGTGARGASPPRRHRCHAGPRGSRSGCGRAAAAAARGRRARVRRRLALVGPLGGLALGSAGPGSSRVSCAPGASASAGRSTPACRRSPLAVADALAGGHSLRGALGEATRSLGGAAGHELRRVRSELAIGAATDDALEAMRARVRSQRLDTVVAACALQRRAGGDLARLLRESARAMEEQSRLEGELRAATAQARFTGVLVAGLPLGGAALAELASPGWITGLWSSFLTAWLVGIALFLQVLPPS